MGVAAKIGELTKKHGISLKELSREIDIPYTTLYHAVKRDSKMEYETVKKIADVLAIDINWLLNGATLEEHNEAFIRQLQHKEPMSARELYLQKHPDDEPAPPQKRNFDLQWLAENFTADEIKMLETYAEFLLSKRDASQRPTDPAQSAAGDAGEKDPEEK